MNQILKNYIDLTRAHFMFAWPLIFCSGLFLGFYNYGGFSWTLLIKAILIGLFGFEGGMILNDYIDKDIDKKDVEHDKLTFYWRPFKSRPLPYGEISSKNALRLFLLFFIITVCLILTLPFPNSLYVLLVYFYCYFMEYFYQVKKRNQKFPIAQVLGRTDFSIFPVAGYLCVGAPDKAALLFFLFFYPLALSHLGLNDLIDIKNDIARKMNTITVLYGIKGTVKWIVLFNILHFIMAIIFLSILPKVTLYGFLIPFALLLAATYILLKDSTPIRGLKLLPLYHLSMAIYSVSIILGTSI
ncbi:MAG: Digeranylgeranylglyceryl phosphate synthase [Candidatus Methanofastidiosum methylothiophilum]|uniref:Digeranylgeranylglyceryl phosphate synthase n=1 Tax=Candidatus Methanofastidiosum methylothiophilum TaxID=1705564 RepID=A0A150IJ88_9EURY|nr:MAG: Digeranylgeranylglyceryl phosphate synthase [Candidatus Methanofastidiosum methylthiophilus]KYC48525.1 MAG: Digeranylgeranylglyceryl phosphate synthase [Candidatus Methanofastidiosum methylthiophilus]KYC51305.1 MAG: Digeranylgeranylglyceryl phosphate synthase [Candidatus Methanofastidiosum methylthiophilus]